MLIRGKQIAATTIENGNLVVGDFDAITGLGTQAQDLVMGSNKITGLTDGSAASDAATKGQVDASKAGLDGKASVRAATAAALPACTAAGSKVGKTLTADAVGVLTVDTSVATVLNDRILVQHTGTGVTNVDFGLYKVTTEGTAGVAFVLTRATDADEDVEVNANMYTWVEEGTANADKGFYLTAWDAADVVDTDPMVFSQFSGLGQITAGTGATKTGDTINVIGGKGITANADDLDADYGLVGAITDVDAGDSAAAGTADTAARGDHQHGVSTAAPTGAVAPGDTNAEGSATTLARSDHDHSITCAAAGAIEPDDGAAEGTNTTFARSDHKHSIVGAVAGTIEPDDVAAEGAATSFARSDHTHAIVAAAPSEAVIPGDTANEGTATSFVRSDHQHAAPAERSEAVTTENITGTDTALGDALDNTPLVASSLSLYLNGIYQVPGAGNDYTVVEATGVITWLASTGTAVDMETTDVLRAVYAG